MLSIRGKIRLTLPSYRIDFEIDAYFSVKQDIDVALETTQKIVIKATNSITNKGSLFLETNKLNVSTVETEARQIIVNFIDYFMVLLNIENIAPLRIRRPELLNPEIFASKTKTNHIDLLSSVAITAPIDTQKINMAAKLMTKQRSLPTKDNETINRALYWLLKAAQSQGEEKFIYRWISLEALSGLVNAGSPQAILNAVVSSKLKIQSARKVASDHKNTIDVLSKAKLCDWKGLKDFSKELSEAITMGQDSKAIVAKSLLCVYCVRNSLFHKGDMLTLLAGTNAFLRDLVNSLIVDTLNP
jgi:hypothetical protein